MGYGGVTAHGIMFHHFHRPGQPAAQGSMTADDLDRMIGFIGRSSILPAREWYDRAVKNTLKPTDICLTFDDNLMCQYEVALPVLAAHGLTAFFFIYSSVSEGNIENLEVYRVFRTEHFPSLDVFYEAFERAAEKIIPELGLAAAMRGFRHEEYLPLASFYTPGDRRFRYIRDRLLKPAQYYHVMDGMIKAAGLRKEDLAQGLWMNDACLRDLAAKGHMVGLHSYSHPTRMCDLAPSDQAGEYRRNFDHIARATGEAPVSMSHPCNSYTRETLAALSQMGIRLGFCANMGEVNGRGPLEFPRQDHADVMREMAA